MKRDTVLITVLVALAATTFAQYLDTYRATYEKKVQSIVLEHGQGVIKLNQEYAASLKTVTSKIQASGDLKKTKSAMAEAERFSKETSGRSFRRRQERFWGGSRQIRIELPTCRRRTGRCVLSPGIYRLGPGAYQTN